MSNEAEVKDPDDLTPEEQQEIADIKREELAEQDPNGFDVVNNENSVKETPPIVPEIIGDIDSLSLNEKYMLVLHQVKQLGPLFFVQVSPDTFKLPDRDPLNLIWINILTSWLIASDILAKFEVSIIEAAAQAQVVEGDNTDGDATDTTGNETSDGTSPAETMDKTPTTDVAV